MKFQKILKIFFSVLVFLIFDFDLMEKVKQGFLVRELKTSSQQRLRRGTLRITKGQRPKLSFRYGEKLSWKINRTRMTRIEQICLFIQRFKAPIIRSIGKSQIIMLRRI